MPVITIEDLKQNLDSIEARIANAKSAQRCGATELDRERGTAVLPGLHHERFIAAEELRQALNDRKARSINWAKVGVGVCALAGFIYLLASHG